MASFTTFFLDFLAAAQHLSNGRALCNVRALNNNDKNSWMETLGVNQLKRHLLLLLDFYGGRLQEKGD